MQDSNNRIFKVGDEFHTFQHGMCKVVSINDEQDILCAHVLKTGETCEYHSGTMEMTIVRSWKELADEALNIQNASNLSGVVLSFARVIKEVRRRLEADGKGDNCNLHEHPVCVLFSSKIASLTFSECGDRFSDAYEWAKSTSEK